MTQETLASAVETTEAPAASVEATPDPLERSEEAMTEDLERSLEEELQSLGERLAEQERVAAENNDKFLRAVADLENYRRRARQELDEVRRFGNEQLMSGLLGVIDNFERALSAAETTQNADALRDGVSLIHKQLLETLTRNGLEPIEALGTPFDPGLHEALMQTDAEGEEPNTVVEELRKGYTLHGRLLRPSLVKVAM